MHRGDETAVFSHGLKHRLVFEAVRWSVAKWSKTLYRRNEGGVVFHDASGRGYHGRRTRRCEEKVCK